MPTHIHTYIVAYMYIYPLKALDAWQRLPQRTHLVSFTPAASYLQYYAYAGLVPAGPVAKCQPLATFDVTRMYIFVGFQLKSLPYPPFVAAPPTGLLAARSALHCSFGRF